jgi:uncharacterized protein (DUF924 family)
MEIITRKEAQEKGLPRYFTGKPCKHGHVCERLVSQKVCIECKQKFDKGYYVKNKERLLKKVKHYAEANKDKITQYHLEYYARNQENMKKRSSKRYKEKREEISQKSKEYYQKNSKEICVRVSQYNRKNKEKIRVARKAYALKNSAVLSAAKANRKKHVKKATPFWADMHLIKIKHKERVAMTNMTGLEHHVDHIVPLQGENVCGLHIASNMRVILARDNISKRNKWETN